MAALEGERRCWSICDYMSAQHAGVSRCPARVHIADLRLWWLQSFSLLLHLHHSFIGASKHVKVLQSCSGVQPSLRWLFLNRLEFLPHSQALNSKEPRISPAIVHCCDRQLCVLTDTCVPVYPPSVVASVSYCVLPAPASDTVSILFLSEHQRRITEEVSVCNTFKSTYDWLDWHLFIYLWL